MTKNIYHIVPVVLVVIFDCIPKGVHAFYIVMSQFCHHFVTTVIQYQVYSTKTFIFPAGGEWFVLDCCCSSSLC